MKFKVGDSIICPSAQLPLVFIVAEIRKDRYITEDDLSGETFISISSENDWNLVKIDLIDIDKYIESLNNI